MGMEAYPFGGEIACLKCQQKFLSRDRKSNQLCKACVAANANVRTTKVVGTSLLGSADCYAEDED